MGLGVVFYWGPQAWQAWCTPKSQRSATQWLILGVCVGFLGGVLDNGYWGLAWTASYLTSPHQERLFQSGVYFNIPFRQLAGMFAAYCHLQSFWMTIVEPSSNRRRLIGWSIVLAAIYVAALTGLACVARFP